MRHDNDCELVELGAASLVTEGHGDAWIEPIGLMPKAGIADD